MEENKGNDKKEENCIFCKIVRGEISSYKIYEDDDFFGFLDIKPIKKGHVLVIPKKHYRWVWDVENIGGYYEACQKIANAQRKAFNTEQVLSLVIGDEVPHAHVWLIPNVEKGGRASLDLNSHLDLSKEEMKEILEKIKRAL